MASGKIKWWDNKKGFGFIAQDTGQDVFVHHTEVLGGGFKVFNEGDEVTQGQVLIRLDPTLAGADSVSVETELALKRLALRRIDAELRGIPLMPQFGDDRTDLGVVGDVVAEEDHACGLAGLDPLDQAGRRGEPGVRVDDPLPGLLLRCQRVRRDHRRAVGRHRDHRRGRRRDQGDPVQPAP